MKKVVYVLLMLACLYGCADTTQDAEANTTADTTITEACNHPDVAPRVQKQYLIATINDMTIDEAAEWMAMEQSATLPMQGLVAFDVDTVYHQHCILGIHYSGEWIGAYPTPFTGVINFNLRTGDTLHVRDFIKPQQMDNLLALCNQKLQQNIEENNKTLIKGDGLEDAVAHLQEYPPGFTTDNLNNYLITDTGIAFTCEIGFPRVMKGLEPSGIVTLTIAELQLLLQPEGPLGFWVATDKQ